jgi:hypothetical protein
MDFIYYIYFVTGLVRGIVSPLAEVSDIVNSSLAGGINLNHIQGSALGYCLANGAGIARFALAIGNTVYCLSQNTTGAGFTRPPGAAEEISVRYPAATEGIK